MNQLTTSFNLFGTNPIKGSSSNNAKGCDCTCYESIMEGSLQDGTGDQFEYSGENGDQGNGNRANNGIYGNQIGINNTQGNSGDVNGEVTDNRGQVGNGNIMDSHNRTFTMNNITIKDGVCQHGCTQKHH